MMGFIVNNSANFSPPTVSNNASPPPTDPKTATEAEIEAARVMGNFAAKTTGFGSPIAFDRANLEEMMTGRIYDPRNPSQRIEVPEDVRTAAKTLLDSNRLFDVVDHNNDNLVATEELLSFAQTNQVLNNLFGI